MATVVDTLGNSNNKKKNGRSQAQVDKVLARAGLQASPFDPLSLQALQQYLAQRHPQDDNKEEEEKEMTGPAAAASAPLLEQVDIYSPPPAAATREDRLMEQLQLQTLLILDLQRKIENLTGRIKDLESSSSTITTTSTFATMTDTTGLRRRRVTVAAEREVPDVAAPARDHAPVVAPRQNNIFAAAAPPQQQQQPRVVPRAPPADSRLARLVRIFGEMRRRQVPNFEWGLVFKVVIMMAILFSRLGGGASSGDDEDQGIPTKFYILGTVLVGGFLFQTGYAQFLYKFIVEENVLYRILILNQDVVIPPPGPARPQRDNNNNNNNDDGWFDWRETFLGGRIQRGEQAPQAPFLWRCVCEIVLLVSSFVLSIFPMWHPQAPPPPPAAAENVVVVDDDDQQQGVAANDGAPGAVRPPVDPTEPEEDEEEDWDE